MKQYITEAKRFQKLAGILTETGIVKTNNPHNRTDEQEKEIQAKLGTPVKVKLTRPEFKNTKSVEGTIGLFDKTNAPETTAIGMPYFEYEGKKYIIKDTIINYSAWKGNIDLNGINKIIVGNIMSGDIKIQKL